MFRPLPLAASLMLFASTAAYGYDNTEITRAEVPLAVLQTAAHYAPELTFTRFAYEIETKTYYSAETTFNRFADAEETSVRVYELEAQDANGRHIELDILSDGTLEEIEFEKTWDEVPIAVQIELNLHSPDFTPSFIEASVRPDGSTVYEFEGHVKGEFADIEILENGVSISLVKFG